MVVGRHIAGNLYRVAWMPRPEEAERLLVEAAELAGSRVYDVKRYEFDDGYSVLVLVLESHLSLHTWYEPRFATLDVYTCGAHTDPVKAFWWIVEKLRPERVDYWVRDRSSDSE